MRRNHSMRCRAFALALPACASGLVWPNELAAQEVAQSSPPSATASEEPTGAARAVPARDDEPAREVRGAGYIPGYKIHPGLGISPFVPRLGGAPGGVT